VLAEVAIRPLLPRLVVRAVVAPGSSGSPLGDELVQRVRALTRS